MKLNVKEIKWQKLHGKKPWSGGSALVKGNKLGGHVLHLSKFPHKLKIYKSRMNRLLPMYNGKLEKIQ